jgi:heme exporter protein A
MNLNAKALSCERNGRVVFSNLSFSIVAGQCAELRGVNGAGKSSLLRVLAGLVPMAAGELSFDGHGELSQNLHLISHQDALKPVLSVAENLNFWCDMLGGAEITKALAAFQLENLRDDPVQLLSAGQRRRLTLSRLFLADRPIWLLDEPMTALDVTSQDIMRQHLRAHLKNGGMVLAATHGDLGLRPDHVISLGQA